MSIQQILLQILRSGGTLPHQRCKLCHTRPGRSNYTQAHMHACYTLSDQNRTQECSTFKPAWNSVQHETVYSIKQTAAQPGTLATSTGHCRYVHAVSAFAVSTHARMPHGCCTNTLTHSPDTLCAASETTNMLHNSLATVSTHTWLQRVIRSMQGLHVPAVQAGASALLATSMHTTQRKECQYVQQPMQPSRAVAANVNMHTVGRSSQRPIKRVCLVHWLPKPAGSSSIHTYPSQAAPPGALQ